MKQYVMLSSVLFAGCLLGSTNQERRDFLLEYGSEFPQLFFASVVPKTIEDVKELTTFRVDKKCNTVFENIWRYKIY